MTVRAFAHHDDGDGKGNPSGCGYHRITQVFDEMRRHGHDVNYAAGFPADLSSYPVIVGQRFDRSEALPKWRRFRAHSRLVYEIDDDVWNVTRENWMAYRTYHWHSSLDTVETAAGIADLVTVTTESLAEILRKHNPEVAVIPNMISEALLSWPRPKPVTHGRRRRVTIGWRGGASHALDVQVIAPAVRKVLKGCPWARLLVVGTDFRPSFECPADFTNWVPVSANLRYYRSIQPFDINLAPLSGQQFDISKSDISALETAALGIPTIAADMEPYREFVIDGKTGYLVSRRADWAKRIRELVCDDAAREEMGRAAREQARARTIESGYTRWVDAYEGLGR